MYGWLLSMCRSEVGACELDVDGKERTWLNMLPKWLQATFQYLSCQFVACVPSNLQSHTGWPLVLSAAATEALLQHAWNSDLCFFTELAFPMRDV